MPLIHDNVVMTKERSEWPARDTLAALDVSKSRYYRWLAIANGTKERLPDKRFNAHAVLPEEVEAALKYAREHPTPRHRELAWRMVDAGVAFLSMSSVYRILDDAGLIRKWKREYREVMDEFEVPNGPNEIWATDFAYFKLNGVTYYLIFFIDEYSRYIVWWDLVASMDGNTTGLAMEAALATLPKDAPRPKIRSDNGSGFISKDVKRVLKEWQVGHLRITPHTPEENPFAERVVGTVRDLLAQQREPTTFQELREAMALVVRYYNEERLHSSLSYLPPVAWHTGVQEPLLEERQRLLAFHRQRRVAINVGRRQTTLMAEEVYEKRSDDPQLRDPQLSRGVNNSQTA